MYRLCYWNSPTINIYNHYNSRPTSTEVYSNLENFHDRLPEHLFVDCEVTGDVNVFSAQFDEVWHQEKL